MPIKPPSANESVLQNALYCAHLANAVYLANPKRYDHYADFQFDDFETFESADEENFGFVGHIPGALLLALRGSDSAEDWWNNFHFGQTEDYDGMVHSGFYFAANSVWSPMIKLMGRLWKAGDVVWVAGHSLGGAMATLAARWVVAEKYDVAGVFTFGQPRVGDNDYADNYPLDDIHYRFVNDKDFVPQVPYRWMGPGVYYKHVGKPYIFDADGNLSRAEREWNSLVRDFASDMLVRGPGAARLPVYNFEDHALERYIERIEAALAE